MALTPEQRAALAKNTLASLEQQLFLAELDRAANVGNAPGIAAQDRLIAQLTRGIAEVKRAYAAELAAPTPEDV